MPSARVTVGDLEAMKARGERIPALTAYDYTSARILDAAGIPLLLVGDTLGMVVLGHDSTLRVTLDHVVHHARAVTRGAHRALVVGDLPFMSYQIDTEQALRSAARLIQEGECRAVKLEGGAELAPTIARLVECGLPVCGHLGYTPQAVHRFGRAAVQGRTEDAAVRLLRDAEALQSAGAFAVVLELAPAPLARELARRLRIPVIGIGSGPGCDGEIQVFHDLFGLYSDFVPRHTRRYLELAESIREAAAGYADDVRRGRFPTRAQSAGMDAEVLSSALARLPG